MVYSGDLLQAQSWADQSGNGVKLIYQMPKSGVPIWFDMLAIPTGAPNFRAAHAWINYLMTPKAIASVSNLLKQPNAIPASSPYLLPILKTSVATPNPETLKNAFCIHDIDPALKPLLSRLWFKVKYGE